MIFLCFTAILVLAVSGQAFPSFLTRLGGDSLQQGLLLSALFFFFPVSSVAAGIVADRIGKVRVVTFGVMLIALPLALIALFQDVWARIVTLLLFGVGAGIIESQISALLTDVNPARERSIMNLSQTLFSVGAAAGPFLLAVIYTSTDRLSITAVFWFLAALNALIAAGFPLLRRSAFRSGEHEALGLKKLLRNRTLLALAVSIFLYVAVEMGTAGWLAKYGEIHLGMSRELAPVCITLFWGSLGLSRALVGVLTHRIPDRIVLVFAVGLSIAAQAFSFSVGNTAASLLGIAILGFGMGCIWPTLVALAGSRFRGDSGSAVGIMVAAGALSIPLIQMVIGFTSRADILGLKNSLLGLSALSVLNLLLILRIFRRSSAFVKAS
ncbi:MAG: MFS transporter [Spirochaetaceae bacterium]|nr:MAG: MFS transporter [Spirochaetaceae bacterium]